MNSIRSVLRDRRRAQHGGVLSGVLILTAFIAILSAALMTELSGNFLLSQNLTNRINREATVNSAIELSLSQMQSKPISSGCPGPTSATLNGITASATYSSCWPTNREASNFPAAGGLSAPFAKDGTQVQSGAFHDYVVGDSAGNVFDYPFGSSAPRWTAALGGSTAGVPLMIINGSQVLDVVPLSGPKCSSSPYCIDVLSDAGSSSPPGNRCVIPAASAVTAEPSASPAHAGFLYYLDGVNLRVSDLSGSDCDSVASTAVSGAVEAGPIAFRSCAGCSTDSVYAVVTDGAGNHLLSYTSSSSKLTPTSQSLLLPNDNVVGFAASSTFLPATLVITFATGGVELIQLASGGGMSAGPSYSVGAKIADAAAWCTPCGNLIGVGAQNGGFYLFDASLTPIASYAAGSAIDGTPSFDGAGDWYIATRDGFVHEVQVQSGQASLVQRNSYGPMGQPGSALELSSCPAGICMYFGAKDNNIYLVPLDARDAVISACVSTSPPTCSGSNPVLSAHVEVGSAVSAQTVHVKGWSYYSG